MGFLRRLFRGSKNKSPSLNNNNNNSLPSNQHAIAVAAASAAVAEAALAAAQAAAEVVRLTTAPASAHQRSLEQSVAAAAVKIQSAFRAYLARRALGALKALVKLQALVRGHIVRKQMADMLRRMQTLVRLQARARASRSDSTASSLSSVKSSLSQYPKSLSAANYRGSSDIGRAKFGSWLDRWMEESVLDNSNSDGPVRNKRHEDEWSAKILEVDTWKPHFNSQTNHGSCEALLTRSYNSKNKYIKKTLLPFDIPLKYLSQPSNLVPSLPSEEVVSLRSLNLPKGKGSAENSPQVVMRGSLTPTRSECSWGCLSSFSGHPNYMANTESSRAKVRSQSAPRQRVQVKRYGSSKRTVVEGSWDGRSTTNSERSYPIYSKFPTNGTGLGVPI